MGARNELDKLALLAGDSGQVLPEHLQIVGAEEDMDIFSFVDAVVRGVRPEEVWRRVFADRLAKAGDRMLFGFLHFLVREARILWQLSHGEEQAVFLPGGVKNRKRDLAARLGEKGVARLFELAMEAELGIKSGARRPEQAFEALVGGLYASLAPPKFLTGENTRVQTPCLSAFFSLQTLRRGHFELTMSKGPHYTGHRRRLRDRLMRDARSMADYEVLELLLAYALPRRDTKPLAKALLTRFGTLRGVLEARPRDLMAVDGFGPGLAAFWALWAEVRARAEEAPVAERAVLGSPAEVAGWGIARLGGKALEEVWAALVDNKNRLVAWERIGQGTPDNANAPVRAVLALALEHKASGMVLVHNHPGGDPRPSEHDLDYTRRVMRAARELGVRLLDHLIVTEDRYFSLREEGLL